ncbi:MAG: aminotransferase class [Crocinitomicaceae bacterium]|jgi:branched-chain amino acid aminotransferase|nr:aminotransferase class [Crocinitomicaceae bacterium]
MSVIYVNNNGEVLPNEGATIAAGNRSYLYGDGIFESIRIVNGKAININNHYKRLTEGAKVLKMRLPSFYSAEFFQSRIQELIDKSDIPEGGKCKISIDRASGGTYFPETNEVTYFIEVYPYHSNLFELNSKGLEIDIYTDLKKQKNFLSNYKTKNGIMYVMAAINAKEKNLDDLLITNDRGGILESTNSNLFIVSNGVLYTPGLDEGCLAGTMRMQVINLAIQHGIKVYECSILPQNILAADEIFLTNAIRGIQWVGGYRTKRYFNTTARKIQSFLNDYWENF